MASFCSFCVFSVAAHLSFMMLADIYVYVGKRNEAVAKRKPFVKGPL